jgi:hypothetical protein
MDSVVAATSGTVMVTSEELSFLAQLVGVEGIAGSDPPPIADANPDIWKVQLEYGARSLLARGVVQTDPNGNMGIDYLLQRLVTISGKAERSFCVLHIRPDGSTEGYFDHQYQGAGVIHERPLEGLHRLTLNPDPGACISQILAFCGCETLQAARAQPVVIPEPLFMETRAVAALGDVLTATRMLMSGRVPRTLAGLLATTFAGPHDVYVIVLIRRLSDSQTLSRQITVIRGTNADWGMVPAPGGVDPRGQILAPITTPVLREALESWL